jgi:hypothetical protein
MVEADSHLKLLPTCLLDIPVDVTDIPNLSISLPIPVTGPEGPSKFLVLSWELVFYEINVASQKNVGVKSD